MSDEERNESTAPSESPEKAASKPLPIKWIAIGIGGLFLIEIIVGVVLWMGKSHDSSSPGTSPSPSPSASPGTGHQAAGSHASATDHQAGSTEAHGTVEHSTTDASTEHSGEHVAIVVPSESTEHTIPSSSPGATAYIAPTPSPTPVIRLDKAQFPSLTFPPDGEIQVDLKDAGKLLEILTSE